MAVAGSAFVEVRAMNRKDAAPIHQRRRRDAFGITLLSRNGGRVGMSKFREKAQGLTKRTVGQMIGDDELVREGREQQRTADTGGRPNDDDQDSVAKGR
jgi:uncharacterized protein YjbJ (UPF0337 family)